MNAKSIGITGLLVALFGFMAFMTSDPWYDLSSSTFLLPNNIENLLRRISMYGLMGIGVAFVIITSGIDLSIGSIVCLAGCLLGTFLQVDYRPADSFDVYRVRADKQQILVHGNASKVYAAGDQIRLFRGRSPAALTIREVEAVQLADRDGQPIGIGTVIDVNESLDRDDDTGQIARAFNLLNSSPTQDGQNATIEVAGIPYPLTSRDRVTLFHPSGGLQDFAVRSSLATGDRMKVEMRGSLGGKISDDWLVMPTWRYQRMSIPAAIMAVLAISAVLGLLHGLLVTRAHLQPFVVTLCGLLIYRGVSRWLVNDNPVGFGIEYKHTLSPLGSGKLVLSEWSTDDGLQTFGIPYPFFVFIAASILAAIYLNLTVWGRYLLALGSNEEAAKYSGIQTQRVTMMAYVICTLLAGVAGILFALDSGSISPSSFGSFYELYAIAAAVLGGCSLRGGEGSIFGVIAGTAVMMLLNNLILLLKIADRLEFTIIGLVILLGVLIDETIRRYAARRRAMKPSDFAGS